MNSAQDSEIKKLRRSELSKKNNTIRSFVHRRSINLENNFGFKMHSVQRGGRTARRHIRARRAGLRSGRAGRQAASALARDGQQAPTTTVTRRLAALHARGRAGIGGGWGAPGSRLTECKLARACARPARVRPCACLPTRTQRTVPAPLYSPAGCLPPIKQTIPTRRPSRTYRPGSGTPRDETTGARGTRGPRVGHHHRDCCCVRAAPAAGAGIPSDRSPPHRGVGAFACRAPPSEFRAYEAWALAELRGATAASSRPLLVPRNRWARSFLRPCAPASAALGSDSFAQASKCPCVAPGRFASANQND
jgi:hypothetical protein